MVNDTMSLQDSSITSSLKIEDSITFTSLQQRYHSFTCIEKIRLRRLDPALQKTPGQTALPTFSKIVYANFRRNQDHSLNVRHASVLVFNASVSIKEQA
jgi:hypothetical protein